MLANAYGQEMAINGLEANLRSYEFSVADFPAGIYFLSIKEGSKHLFTTRLVVLK